VPIHPPESPPERDDSLAAEASAHAPPSPGSSIGVSPGPSAPPSPLAKGELVADRYRVQELLGSGAMGVVYRVEHVHIKKLFALKVLHAELNQVPEVVARFEREAIAAARIEHENVARATDFGRLADGSFYLVLDYVQGQSLRDLLADRVPLPPPRALAIARQVASALDAAHQAGIVHRDLKPDNIMLVGGEGEGDRVKVLDFGIAKLQLSDLDNQPALTRAGTVFGTPEYMSPEQAAGGSVDARSDLYSLGIVLYEMLAGSPPFAGLDVIALITRHMTAQPPPLAEDLPAELREFIPRLLAKDPSERPASASTVAESLDRISSTASTTSAAAAPADHLVSLVNADTVLDLGRTTSSREPQRPPRLARLGALRGRWLIAARGWLRKEERVFGRSVRRLWLLTLGLGILAASVTLAALSGNEAGILTGGSVAGSAFRALPSALLERARRGEPAALDELKSRPARGGAPKWAALARGYSAREQYSEMLRAYARAFEASPELSADPQVALDIARAARDPKTSKLALDLAAQRLGATGADLIYAISREAKTTRHAGADLEYARDLLARDSVRARASPALQVVLALDTARGCTAYRALLTRVTEVGDQRSLRFLYRLRTRRGCGLLGLGDCYRCLRSNRALSNAIATARSRPAPSFRSEPDERPDSPAADRDDERQTGG